MYGKTCPFYIGIEEVKPASESSNRSDIAIVALYAIGEIVAVGIAGMMIRNRIHNSILILKSCSLSEIFFSVQVNDTDY